MQENVKMWTGMALSVLLLAMVAGCTISFDNLFGPAAIVQRQISDNFDVPDGGWWTDSTTVLFSQPLGEITQYKAYANGWTETARTWFEDDWLYFAQVKLYVNIYREGSGPIAFDAGTRTVYPNTGFTSNYVFPPWDDIVSANLHIYSIYGEAAGIVTLYAITEYNPPPPPTTTTTTTQATTTSTSVPTTTTSVPTTTSTTTTVTTVGWASISVTATGGVSTPISNLQVNVHQDGGVIAYKSDTTDSQGRVSFSVEPGHTYTVKGTIDSVTMSGGPTMMLPGTSWQPTLNWPMVTPPTTTWTGTGTPPPTTDVIDVGQFTGLTTDTMLLLCIVLLFVGVIIVIKYRVI